MTGACRIVVCHRGWVLVGLVSREENELVIRRARTIRRWGTTKGLGEIAKGPTSETKLDEAGTVRMHPLSCILMLDADIAGWTKHLGEP